MGAYQSSFGGAGSGSSTSGAGVGAGGVGAVGGAFFVSVFLVLRYSMSCDVEPYSTVQLCPQCGQESHLFVSSFTQC